VEEDAIDPPEDFGTFTDMAFVVKNNVHVAVVASSTRNKVSRMYGFNADPSSRGGLPSCFLLCSMGIELESWAQLICKCELRSTSLICCSCQWLMLVMCAANKMFVPAPVGASC